MKRGVDLSGVILMVLERNVDRDGDGDREVD